MSNAVLGAAGGSVDLHHEAGDTFHEAFDVAERLGAVACPLRFPLDAGPVVVPVVVGAASAWHTMRIRVRRSLPRACDAATGELLPPGEPSVMETMPFRDKLDAALFQVVEILRPLAATLVAELLLNSGR